MVHGTCKSGIKFQYSTGTVNRNYSLPGTGTHIVMYIQGPCIYSILNKYI
jgi:hypothetical protein